MGFDYDFAERVPDSLICAVCEKVLEIPVVTSCTHVFCKQCLSEWLKEKSTCPKCRREMDCDEAFPAPGYFSGLISELKARCDNFDRGCKAEVALFRLPAHRSSCEFGIAHCQFEKCPLSAGSPGNLLSKNKLSHEQECQYRPVQCPNQCGMLLTESSVEEHLQLCSNTIVRCELECGVSIKRAEQGKHQESHCPNYITSCCVDDCSTKVLRFRLQDHMNKHVSELHHSVNENADTLRASMTSTSLRFGKLNHTSNELRARNDLSDIALNEFWERLYHSTLAGLCNPIAPFLAAVYCLSTWYLDVLSFHTGILVVILVVIFCSYLKQTMRAIILASTTKTIPFKVQAFREHVVKGEIFTSSLFIADGYQCQMEIATLPYLQGNERRVVAKVNVFTADIDDWLIWPPPMSVSLTLLGEAGLKCRFPMVSCTGTNGWRGTKKGIPRGSYLITLGTYASLTKRKILLKDTLLGVCHVTVHK
eukprot:CFRG5486T1